MFFNLVNLNKKWALNTSKLFSTKTSLLIEPVDVSKFSDTTPTDPDMKDCLEAQERVEKKVEEFKDPGTLEELRERVETKVLRCETTEDAKFEIDDIIRDTISSANKFNEEMREDNQELIDKARALHSNNKMTEEELSNFSREQEKWIADNISDNNRHLNREIEIVKDVGESLVRDYFEAAEMSSVGGYSTDSDKNNSGGLKVEENKSQGPTSEVGEEKPDTGNTDVDSSKSESNISKDKPSLLDDYADPNSEPFDPFDPDL